ncbi:MAG TPA: BON domain-containing protein [Burkholderiales bacterium]|nr:BON domain-containing protein [Burkholderiales bacterium]
MPTKSSNTLRIAILAAGLMTGLGISAAQAASESATSADTSQSTAANASDADITAHVQTKLKETRALGKSHIHVTTSDGVVTLTGKASSTSAKSEAERVAKSVDGVKAVHNKLNNSTYSKDKAEAHSVMTDTEREASDAWITTKVKSDILANSLTKGFDVNVDTRHGVVYLKGHLANQTAVDHVKRIAESVHGVKSVDASGLTAGQ